MNKQRKDCLTFIQNEKKKKMEYTQHPYTFKFGKSSNCLTIFLHSK